MARWLLVAVMVAVMAGEAKGFYGSKKSNEEPKMQCEDDMKSIVRLSEELVRELSKLKGIKRERTSRELTKLLWMLRKEKERTEEAFFDVMKVASSEQRDIMGIQTIETDDSAMVNDVFLSGSPYLVQCAGALEPLHKTFVDASPGLVESSITPAAMDCNGTLPSGKTVVERFFKGKKMHDPLFFVVSNKRPPRSFTIRSHVTPEFVVEFAVNATAVVVSNISSQEDLREECLRRRQCAVVLHDGNYSEHERSLVLSLAPKFRGVAFVQVDSRKLQFSLEDALPASSGKPRLVYMEMNPDGKEKKSREKSFSGKAFKGVEWSEDALSGFLEGVTSKKTKLAKLKKHPKVTERKLTIKQSKSRVQEKEQAGARAKARGGAGAKPKGGERRKNRVNVGRDGKMSKSWEGDKQEQQQDEREKERRRREEMLKEAANADGIEYVGDEGGDEEGAEGMSADAEEVDVEEIVVDGEEGEPLSSAVDS